MGETILLKDCKYIIFFLRSATMNAHSLQKSSKVGKLESLSLITWKPSLFIFFHLFGRHREQWNLVKE